VPDLALWVKRCDFWLTLNTPPPPGMFFISVHSKGSCAAPKLCNYLVCLRWGRILGLDYFINYKYTYKVY